jgi:hypothetical protein
MLIAALVLSALGLLVASDGEKERVPTPQREKVPRPRTK